MTVLKKEKQGEQLTNALLLGSLTEPLTQEYLGSHTFKQEAATFLRTLLTSLLAGDSVAAEFLFLNLVSKYYQTKDLILFDNFPLNVIGMSELDEVEGTGGEAPSEVLIRFI